MIDFPNAKINLGLRVTGKRADGFHNIETVFYPVGLCDILEIIKAADGKFEFTSSGLRIAGSSGNNLCVKAYNLLADQFHLAQVKIHLHKIIPMGAGLGGGSSDGAFTLKMLNSLFHTGLSEEELADYARQLGSDCAFFIKNQPAFATGKGDQFEPLNIDLSPFRIVIVIPEIHVNTADAYSMIDRLPVIAGNQQIDLRRIRNQPLKEWKTFLTNDFEQPVFSNHPEIRQIKEQLYQQGAIYASMTGSGAGVYGIFEKKEKVIKGFEDCFVWAISGLSEPGSMQHR
ncbi:MAG: 4-(cytidine 5'-diphospho)-2-C-methyl-D-erythritol kinase [Bacteroidetes bacterium]|nr:4-(cytidine 5'-diphospho)-2-C-methyl-D-erythritol kinase [Bacteroidota bacterium]